jgi:FkbH-like protein
MSSPLFSAEPVRLVIWDLDETFWHGTLTEGGARWVEEHAEIVRELARRGILSSICSKNDKEPVFDLLAANGLRDFFVFPSLNWEAKGPRLAQLVKAVQLRPASILFIDDNPMNRAEAAEHVPGLQIADETVIATLLDNPRFQGKPDPDFSRLQQYRLLETRHQDMDVVGSDNEAFLRASGIEVTISFDVEKNIDRAIELINRTNQLNFTKRRLPEEPEAARAQLRALLERHTTYAGLVHVRDRYGDYGFCGIFIMRRAPLDPARMLDFAFSCRTLGMGIETWVYRWLDKPPLTIKGEVVNDVTKDNRSLDWIAHKIDGLDPVLAQAKPPLAYIVARGGCDTRVLTHYLDALCETLIEEFNQPRGIAPFQASSLLVQHELRGIPESLKRDCVALGFQEQDWHSALVTPPAGKPGVWLLSFAIEQPLPVLRHKESGACVHAPLGYELRVGPRQMLDAPPERSGLAPEVHAYLNRYFEMVGPMPEEMFRVVLQDIFNAAPPDIRIFVILANERSVNEDGSVRLMDYMAVRNTVIREVAADFGNIDLIDPMVFIAAGPATGETGTPHHFHRMVYYKIFEHITARLTELGFLAGLF